VSAFPELPLGLLGADAPAPGTCVRVERPEKGLAVLVLDPPHRKPAVLDLPLMRDLAAALDKLAQDGGLEGLVITGREPTRFAVGADLDVLAAQTDAALVERLAAYGQAVFERIARLRVRTIAAVGGPVPGGAYELCLACNWIVACDDASTRLGLPETQLGILPGWGGSQRLPRRIGVPAALEAILAGKLYPARAALKRGMVDRLTQPELLRRVACDLALGRAQVRRRERGPWAWLVDRNPVAIAVIGRAARADVQKKSGGHYPALPRALELVLAAPHVPLHKGLADEARALGELGVSSVCKHLIGIFRMSEDAKKLARLPQGEPRTIARAGVIGAGVMGGAIAGLFAERGVDARLCDLAAPALDAAVLAHRASVAKALARKRLEPHEARAAIDRLGVSLGTTGLRGRDLVLEAVAEKLEVKRAVLIEVARQAGDGAILATNTSSLSVDAIAQGLPHPQRVVGMHFFNPVAKMPLVEIIRGRETTDEVVAATARLALQLGKTPVVVRDVAGFLVNRLLGPYLDEAVRLLEAGVEPQRVDRAARAFGMPMGPIELIDEVGLDIAEHAAASLHQAYGARMAPSPVLARLRAAGLTGKKGGQGFYLWTRDARGRVVRGEVSPLLREHVRPPARGQDISEGGIVDQLVLVMLNEAWLALSENVVDSPRAIDLATIFGMGFPPFRGGLMRYGETRGATSVLHALRALAAAPDVLARDGAAARFTPAPGLVRSVASASRG
jgi:3-hydroxyacyl-CoA dehydrogenase/enoyl-CoA hydratase/3-hydroxybutyryl-CoA epimerase